MESDFDGLKGIAQSELGIATVQAGRLERARGHKKQFALSICFVL